MRTGKYLELIAKNWLETNWIEIIMKRNLYDKLLWLDLTIYYNE